MTKESISDKTPMSEQAKSELRQIRVLLASAKQESDEEKRSGMLKNACELLNGNKYSFGFDQ